MKQTAILTVALYAATTFPPLGGQRGAAQTPIPGGNVYGTWTLALSPYNIQGSIQIPNDSTLTIEPGVTVEFQGIYKPNLNKFVIFV